MFNVGDKVQYTTSRILTINRGEKAPQIKEGIIEESFTTLDGFPCFWILNEPELILGRHILSKIK